MKRLFLLLCFLGACLTIKPNQAYAANAPTIAKPTILQQPGSLCVKVGSPIFLSVKVSNTTGVTYQWFRDGMSVAGATKDTYFIPYAQASIEGNYTVNVTNAGGVTKSSTASLSVAQPPRITRSPVSANVKEGSPVTFIVAVSSATDVTYQWFRDGVSIAGAIKDKYSIPSAEASSEGNYTVNVTNAGGVTTSAIASLSLVQPPVIIQQPVSASVNVGSRATFSVKVSNETGVTYRWFRGDIPIGGATTKDFSIVAARQTDVGTYWVQVSNLSGSVKSDKVKLGVSSSTVSRFITPSMVSVLGGTLPSTSNLRGKIVKDFYLGKYEVTWSEWKTVRDWAVRTGYTDLMNVGEERGDNHPVWNVNWYDAVKWCNARSEKEGRIPVYQVNGATYKTGQSEPTVNTSSNGYRLPTSAEWEWAARGGRQTHGYKYSGSNDLNSVAWTYENSGELFHEVGTKAPNELGIYDMSGNASEWCWDLYKSTLMRIIRSGDDSGGLDGSGYMESYFYNNYGFRVALSSVP